MKTLVLLLLSVVNLIHCQDIEQMIVFTLQGVLEKLEGVSDKLKGYEAVEQKQDEIMNKLMDMQEKLDHLDNSLKDVQQKLDKLESNFQDFHHDLEHMKGMILSTGEGWVGVYDEKWTSDLSLIPEDLWVSGDRSDPSRRCGILTSGSSSLSVKVTQDDCSQKCSGYCQFQLP
ncbi:uncharacterized protein [Palaemon carinicauda]|uniref:uncharacterized protein n=1 Tax=Palaemon carinicauda TaxID=392227 RepID=UPI0035B6AA18